MVFLTKISKLHNAFNNKKTFFALNILVFLFLIYIHTKIPFYSDDFRFRYSAVDGKLINSIRASIESANLIYVNNFGRYLASIINPLVQLQNKWIFNVINSALIVITINLMLSFIDSKSSKSYFFIILLSLFVVLTPNFIGSVLWLSSSVEYFWGIPLFLLLIILRKSDINFTLIIILSFITASYNELLAVSVSIFNAFYLLDDINFNPKKVIKFKNYSIKNLSIFIISVIGAMVTIFAPGNLIRLTGLPSNSLGISNTLFSIFRLGYYVLLELWILIIIIITLLYNKKNRLIIDSSSHYLFVFFFTILALSMAGGFSMRTLLLPAVLLIIIIIKMMDEMGLLLKLEKTYLLIISIYFIFIVGALAIQQILMIEDSNSRNIELDVYEMIEDSNSRNIDMVD